MSILHKNKIIKLFISLLIQAMVFMPVFAIDLDYTVDDTIRKNYNTDIKIVPATNKKTVPTTTVTPVKAQTPTTSMPKLPTPPKTTGNGGSTPSVVKTTTSSKVTQTKTKTQAVQKTYTAPVAQPISRTYSSLPVRKGMEFDIVNINAISDKQKVGTNIVFTAKRPIKTAYYTIPQGTKFVGKIVESHTPQIVGNGGLVSISVVTIILSGDYQHIDTRITKVSDKNVFFEDIKGKRSYWKNTVNKGKWGRKTFHKMNKLSSSLAKDKTTVILSPFTFVYGAAMGGISILTSPVVSIFCKGGHVYLPVNTTFRIKFEEDAKLYY